MGRAPLFLIVFDHHRCVLNGSIQQFHEGRSYRRKRWLVFTGQIAAECEPVDRADRLVSSKGGIVENKIQIVPSCCVRQREGYCFSASRRLFNAAPAYNGSVQFIKADLKCSTCMRRSVIEEKMSPAIQLDLFQAGASSRTYSQPLGVNEFTIDKFVEIMWMVFGFERLEKKIGFQFLFRT